MSGLSNLGITVGDFYGVETGMAATGYRPMYAFPLEAPQGDLDRKKSPLSDDIEAYGLINEELPDAMSSYYEKVRGEYEERGGRLFLDRIFTTGLPEEDVGRYYSENF